VGFFPIKGVIEVLKRKAESQSTQLVGRSNCFSSDRIFFSAALKNRSEERGGGGNKSPALVDVVMIATEKKG